MLLFADGETIYKNKCAACHEGYIPMGALKENFVEFNNTKLKLKAPTLNQLSFRLKQKIGDPKGDEEIHMLEVVEFVKSYIIKPDKQKSICMDEVLEAFDIMPSMQGKITEEESEEVASYIYHFDKQALKAHAPVYVDIQKALTEAKKEDKLIMIKAASEHCHFCKKMDREVLSDKEIRAVLQKNFIAVEVDVYKEDLPLHLSYKVTPTYIFVTAEGKKLKSVVGALSKQDFLKILETVKQIKKGDTK